MGLIFSKFLYLKNLIDECFDEIEQRVSCQRICFNEIGPVCRANVHKNLFWPTVKGNLTIELKCFSTTKNAQTANKKAYRKCHVFNSEQNIYNNEIFSKWQNADISECVHEFLIKIKKDIFNFHTTDNFDENQIIRYAEQLYSLSVKFAKKSVQRTIYDISTIIDSMHYLINAQVS